MYLKERVKKSIKHNGDINLSDLQTLKNLKNNPITQRLLLRYSHEGILDFDELFDDLNSFVCSKQISKKINILFKMYDSNKDGLIDKFDLFEIIKNYSDCKNDKNIMNIVNSTFDEAGAYLENLNFEQFKNIILSKSLNLKVFFRC